MKNKVIFIDDQESMRHIYKLRLQRLFGDIAEVVALEPLPTANQMINKIVQFKDVSSYIIDENLTHSGNANYQGVTLIEKIRELDSKVPIYILTSDTSWVDPLLGDIEFVIDKLELNIEDNKAKFLQKFIRHLSTYQDIKTEQAKRFDELLIKSLSHPLSKPEEDEFNSLNAIRAKVFLDEARISEKDIEILKEKRAKIHELEAKLQELKD